MIRESTLNDYPEISIVRMAVHENKLSDPSKVTYADYVNMQQNRGKGWVYEEDGKIVGFSIIDLQDRNIWALFVLPEKEKAGIGRKLHDTMISWCFQTTSIKKLWLSTDPHTRAEGFYIKAGWQRVGIEPNGEIRFELSKTQWENRLLDESTKI